MNLTIIMPSLNVAPYIKTCIESVVNQTMYDIEILCVDAGSTDGTLEILEQLKKEDARIKIIHSDKKSYGYQVNLGLDIASGDYIGIVETDDFIACDMYETLYALAVEHDLDYAKGAYRSFVSLDDKNVFSWESRGMGNRSEYFDCVIDACTIPYIYAMDACVWSGIYKRDFLNEYNIRFHESPGAAYQDIGFLQQTIGCARRAWYSSRSFYRYRVDREESSVKSPKGLNYSRAEFERIVSDTAIFDKIANKNGLYTRMLASFLWELKKVLPMVAYDMESMYVKDSFRWFMETLKDRFVDSILEADKVEYESIVRDRKGFLDACRTTSEKTLYSREEILRVVLHHPVIIFGAGIRGGQALNFLIARHCDVVAFCDNSEEKQTEQTVRMPVLALDVCMREFADAVYVIANKYHAEDIRAQLMRAGVAESRIAVFES